ncbi:MAG TPA: agmatine deiminase family protein [Saprospiraceae bacterium]|nr:agmatine deiminase family protein [Saprospiraceae bacterium]HMP24191.1 agmatine deiminase family protein [Saprospiraceae bacterium]
MNRRLPAEWEPQSAVQFTFPHADSDWAEALHLVSPCFVALIETVSQYQKVLVVCADAPAVRSLLSNARAEHLLLVEIPSNDTWARDHGAITIVENDEPVLLDFMFNGWGLKFPADRDNLITKQLFAKGIFNTRSLRHGGIVLEGGAIESDGQGTLLTTAQCLLSPNRNPHLTQSDIENRLKDLFGLQRVLWLQHGHLEGDDTDAHIDTLARFCNENTIAYVQCTNPTDAHYAALQQMEQELQAFRQINGAPYRLVPLPMPTAMYAQEGYRLPATYANFLIINEAVLVPIYNVPEDAAALAQVASCFPDRKVIGIDCSALILQHGSLHCVTMQYPAGVV